MLSVRSREASDTRNDATAPVEDDDGADRPGQLDIRVLGPLEVRSDGGPVHVGGPRLRALIALLTANLGHVVSMSALVDALWGMDAPGDAHRTARTYVSRLRHSLPATVAGSEPIVTQAAGYQLRLPPELVDATRFERLATTAHRELLADQPLTARERLSAGLALWRGDAYDEFGHVPALRAEGARLRQLWLTATEDHIDAQLATGAGDTLIGRLIVLTGRYPGHDRLWRQLMTAQYRAGRQTEALETFVRARAALAEQSGLDPSPALVEIHRQVLEHDSRLLVPVDAPTGATRIIGVRPAQLPPELAGFTGRQRELAALDAAVARLHDQPVGAAVCVLSGTAGVGKTTLAMHWAHRVRHAFPDGQLYVNLRGFDPGGTTLNPAEAARGFLDAFGVPPASVPPSPEAQTALYRSLLIERRMLVVLDNARDADQVRPLLPGASGCLALITSRNQLTSLAVAEGAHLLTLTLLDPAEARELLTNRLGADRVAADPDAVAEIIARCAGLPLALAIVAARAAAQPHLPLAGFASQLRQFGRRLDFLDGGDRATQLRAVFSWSYRTLGVAAARLFRLLALHPGPDFAVPAAAGVAGLPPAQVRPLLAELTRSHLLTEQVPGRYAFHDLLREFATELAMEQDSPDSRCAATHRVLDHYLHTAHAADTVLTPQHRPIALPPPQPHATPEQPSSHQEALVWFTVEHPVLLAAVERSAATGFDAHAWQLAAALTTFLDRHGYCRELVVAHTTALAAAQRRGDRVGQANAYRGLGLAHDRLGNPDTARDHYRRALELFAAVGDDAGQARTHQHLARMAAAHGDYRHARDHAEHSLRHYRALDDDAGRAAALNDLGWCRAQLGQFDQALDCCERALALAEEVGDANGLAHIWDSLGYIHRNLGQHDRSTACYLRAVDLFHRTGERRAEASSLADLGDALRAAGNHQAAEDAWRQALRTLDELDLPNLEWWRTKIIANLDRAG